MLTIHLQPRPSRRDSQRAMMHCSRKVTREGTAGTGKWAGRRESSSSPTWTPANRCYSHTHIYWFPFCTISQPTSIPIHLSLLATVSINLLIKPFHSSQDENEVLALAKLQADASDSPGGSAYLTVVGIGVDLSAHTVDAISAISGDFIALHYYAVWVELGKDVYLEQ